MKTRFFTLLALAVSTLLSLTSCNEFKLDERMLEANFLVHGGEYNKHDSTTRRAWLTLMVKGLNEDPYTLEYTIDGHQGVNEYALYQVDEETRTLVYNSQVFAGSAYISEEMFSGQYNGNFPSGSSTKLHFLDDRSGLHPSNGSASFISPKLEAGKHVIAFTITNSYGDQISGTREFTIQDKPNK